MRKYFSVAGALFCSPKKVPSLIPTGRGRMHTLNLKKFFIPSLIWNWEVETHPVFTKILKNIFFDWEPWFCLLKKSLHLFPLGRGKFQPCFKKYFAVCKTPSLIWNWEVKTQPVFQKKQKNFLKKTVYLKNIPSLVPTGRGHLGIVVLKKGKKICPPEVAGVYVFIKK